jgi:superfamily II DNA or RNA helicase
MGLRQYQNEAISAWQSNDYHGIWELATGTGKTITAVEALCQLDFKQRNLRTSTLYVVVCPLMSLVDQWAETFNTVGWASIKAYQSSSLWRTSLGLAASEAALVPGRRTLVITTISTFKTDYFQSAIARFSGDFTFVGDEVHNFGTENILSLLPKQARFRLGLSATPERYFDAVGSEGIKKYFGQIVASYSLADAIKDGWLAPYFYNLRSCQMEFEEMENYREVSKKLGAALGGQDFRDLSQSKSESVGKLLRIRASILGNAGSKIEMFKDDLLANLKLPGQLVYCAEGSGAFPGANRQVDIIRKLILNEGGGTADIYESMVSHQDRQRMLKMFSSQEAKFLLSMRCLDEGVDVPSAQIGYLLASSSNPRQFIQRRGRILRRFPGKEHATVFDYMAIPSLIGTDPDFKAERAIARREFARAREFADSAINSNEATILLRNMGDVYGTESRLSDF